MKKLEQHVMEKSIGDTVKVAGHEWVVLDHIEGKGTLCLMKDIMEQKEFNEDSDTHCNNWANSSLRKYLNLESELASLKDKLALVQVDLMSDDGMDDYGKTQDYIFPLTADQYRKYRKHIPPASGWWWISTPWTCNSAYPDMVRSVRYSGGLDNYGADSGNIGVRPALIFKESVIADDDN